MKTLSVMTVVLFGVALSGCGSDDSGNGGDRGSTGSAGSGGAVHNRGYE